MDVEMRKIEEVQPYPRNPRVLSPQAIAACAASIKAFGWRQPIVVDEAGVIVAGHMRHAAAMSLGLDEVPVHVATGLTEQEVVAYRLADNSTADLGQWDIDLQQAEMRAIDVGDVSFDWSDFGLELAEDPPASAPDGNAQQRAAQAARGEDGAEADAGAGDDGGDEGTDGHTCPSCGFRW